MTSRVLGETYGKGKVSSKTVWAAGTISQQAGGILGRPSQWQWASQKSTKITFTYALLGHKMIRLIIKHLNNKI